MAIEIKRSKAFKIETYRGKTLDELLEMSILEFSNLCTSKSRRRLKRGITTEEYDLIKDVEKYHAEYLATNERPAPIKTKERTMVILPCMINSVIAVHRGNGYFEVEIKIEMLGKKLNEYVPTRMHPSHARKGVGVVTNAKLNLLR